MRRGRNHLRPAEDLRSHLVAIAVEADRPIVHEQDLISKLQHVGLMGDEYHGRATCLEMSDRLNQGRITCRVEVGVGLVEHNHRWIAKQSPRQSDPLPLPSRQRLTAIADFGVVPVRHLLDHLMYTGKAGGANDPSMVRLSEPGNVLRHRAGKEFNVLRKVADIRPELVWIELIDRETIEPDG